VEKIQSRVRENNQEKMAVKKLPDQHNKQASNR
jgi:hypothetical protein